MPNQTPHRALPRPSLLSVAIAGLLLAPVARGATITVGSAADPGDGSTTCTLREAIRSINTSSLISGCVNTGAGFGTDDTILFASSVTGTITLSSSELQITKSMAIAGPGADDLAVDGDFLSRVFNITGAPGPTVSIEGLTIQNGSDSGNGGGIFIKGSYLALTNSTVSGNSAFGGGGGIAMDSSSMTLTNSTVSGNSAYGGGGIFAMNSSSATLTNSTVSSNSTSLMGGGIFAATYTSATLTNSTVSGNSSESAGGILALFYSTATLTNSIVANSRGGDCVNNFSTVTGRYTLIEDTGANACSLPATDGNIIGSDPLLDTLADNGCVVPSGNPNGDPAYYGCVKTQALLTGSLALNSASAAFAPNDDERGATRPQGAADDRGAFELGPPAQPTDVTATAGPAQVTVFWTPPTHTGLYPLASCTATANPGGASCTAPAGTNQCTITGLTPGTAYTFTVTCTSGTGQSAITGFASAASGPVTPDAPPVPIPTLSVWGLFGSAGLLSLLGAWRQRRWGQRRRP